MPDRPGRISGIAMALRRVATLFVVPLLAYAGLCVLMYARQREMMYFPQHTRVDASQTDFELRRNDVTLRGWVVNPGQAAAVIYFGGNAEAVDRMRAPLAGWLPDRSVYLLSYRGYGASEGAPEEALLFADALALFDNVRARHPSGTVSVIGRSLGTGVASYVASQRPVHRLVLVAPFDSLAGVAQHHYPWLPVRLLIKDRYDSDRHLAGFERPVLVIRAGRDRVVPPRSTDALIAALPSPPTVLAVPDAGHDSVLVPAAPGQALAEFLTR